MRTPEPAFLRGWGLSIALALGVALLAAGLRFDAADRLPLDWDEYVTLRAAYVYAGHFETGRFESIPGVRINNEHPPAAKIAYGLRLQGLERPPIPPFVRGGQPVPEALRENVRALRRTAAVAGAAEAGALALLQPGAGLWMAVQSYHTRYTAEILLEAAAGFFAVWAVVLFSLAWQPRAPCQDAELRWLPLLLSAAALGLAAASKYMYGLPAVFLLPFLLARAPRAGPTAAFVAVGAATFIAAHPGLWSQPWRLITPALTFHREFAAEYSGAWWHPLALMGHISYDDSHGSLFEFGSILDRGFLFFAVLGLPRTAARQPVWFAWALVSVIFLLVWPTKWAHYQLLAIPPLAMCASSGAGTLFARLRSLGREGAVQS